MSNAVANSAARASLHESTPHYYKSGHHGVGWQTGVTLALLPCEDRLHVEARRGKVGRFIAAIRQAFGVEPLQAPMTVSANGVDFVGVGIARWHIISRDADRLQHRALLKTSIEDLATLVDVSHGFTTFEISGPRAAQTLSKLVRCDLDPAVFPMGACVATELHGMHVHLRRTMGGARFECAVPRSFGGSLYHALVTAAEEYGVDVVAPQAGSVAQGT